MSFRIPTTGADLRNQGKKMYAGLLLLGSVLKITQIPPAIFLAILTAFQKADDDFNAARSATQVFSDVYKAAVAQVDDYLAAVKGVLISAFGSGFSVQWVQAGFINNSTQIPSTIADRLALTARLVAFFTKNPTFEVENLKVTAAQGAAVEQAVDDAQKNLTTATRNQKDLGTAWDNAFKALADKEWELIKILQVTLNDDDTRWLEFGLTMPSQSSRPGQPTGLTVQLDVTGALLVQCDATPLATRYRFRMMILGVDTAYSLAASSPSPMALIKGIEPGQTVQIIVQAVNVNQQGVASEPVQFTVLLPMAQRTDAKASAPAASEDEIVLAGRNGHGSANGNGHTNGSRVPTVG